MNFSDMQKVDYWANIGAIHLHCCQFYLQIPSPIQRSSYWETVQQQESLDCVISYIQKQIVWTMNFQVTSTWDTSQYPWIVICSFPVVWVKICWMLASSHIKSFGTLTSRFFLQYYTKVLYVSSCWWVCTWWMLTSQQHALYILLYCEFLSTPYFGQLSRFCQCLLWFLGQRLLLN